MVPQRSCHCVVDVLREWVSMLLSSRECPGGRQRYGSGMQGRVCRKRQISQILAASLEQHTLHNYDDSISAKSVDPLQAIVLLETLWPPHSNQVGEAHCRASCRANESSTTMPQPMTLYQRNPISEVKKSTTTVVCATTAAMSTGVAVTRRRKNATTNSPRSVP